MSLSLASQTGSTLSSPDGSSLASWWVLDDAATKHISSFECLFESTMTLHGAVIGTVGRATVPITKEGNVRVSMMGLKVNLTEVQLVPDARVNVLALERFLAVSGNKYHINDVRRTLEFGAHGIVVPVIKHGGLHWVHADSVRASTATTAAAMVSVPVKVSVATANVDATDLLDLHRRLGHANLIVVKEMAKRVGIVVTSAALKDIPCDDCVLGKSARVSVDRTKADPRSSAPGQYIHTDLNGPMEVKSIGGARYAMVFVDDFTRVTRVYPLRDKTETLSAIQRFTIDAASIGIVFGKGSTLHGDNGTEYRNAAVDRWCLTNGVMQTSCPPHTQALNGVAERYWRTVVDMARTMLIAAALPKSFWVAAMLHATAIRNLLPSQSLGGRAPLAVLTGSQPTFDHLHTFGAKAFVTTPKGMRKKWDPKAREGIYVGFSPVNKSHMVYIPTTGVVVESIHVRIGDLLASVKQASVPEEVLSVPLVPRVGLELVPGHEETVVPNVAAVPNAVADAASDAHDAPIDEAAYSLDGGSSEDEAVAPMAVLVAQQRPPKRRAAELGRAATRAATLPDRDTPPDAVLLSASMTSKRPDVVSLFTPSRAAAQLDPLTLDEALSGSDAAQWSAAYDAELAAMAANGTWDIVPRREMASGARALPVKVVFKTKLNLDGSIDKLKCRIVAKGFAQRSGVDYTDIYSPVVDRTTVRLLLALAAVRFGTQIHQMDVTTAFLNAPIRELVYLQPPPRISDTSDQGEAVVLRLNKAIYGLKQAPRYWHDLLDAFLVTDCNLVRCIVDPCLYIAPDLKDDKFLWVAVYVDDIFLVFNDDMSATALKSAIKGRFKVADLGEAHQWLGMEILATDQGGFSINQTAAIERLLTKENHLTARVRKTPLTYKEDLSASVGELLDDVAHSHYRELVGSINYLAICTRPDLAHAAYQLSRHLVSPTKVHLNAAKGVLRYLRGTPELGLSFGASVGVDVLVGFCDATFASNLENRKSVTGYVFLLNGAAVAWRSKLQSIVATSTAQSEYIAMSSATHAAQALRQLLNELGVPQINATVIHGDNQPALHIAHNAVCSELTRHIDVRYHHIRERVERGEVAFRYVPTDKQVADMFTKPMSVVKHIEFTAMLMAPTNMASSSQGEC